MPRLVLPICSWHTEMYNVGVILGYRNSVLGDDNLRVVDIDDFDWHCSRPPMSQLTRREREVAQVNQTRVESERLHKNS